MREISEEDKRAVVSVADALIGRAGRTSLVMALRGSRAKRVLQFGVDRQKGYGSFAAVPEADVLALVDAMIAARILAIDRSGDFPLLMYTRQGLELAETYAAEEWLRLVRERVAAVTEGAALDLPFIHSKMPNRNLATIGRLIELVEREADSTWLPLLTAWSAVETKRIRGRLDHLIARLSGTGPSERRDA